MRRAALILLGVLALAGCGGSSGPPPLTKRALIEQGDAICSRFRQKAAALQRQAPKQSPTDPSASDDTVREAGPILGQLSANMRVMRRDLGKLTPPKALADAWDTNMSRLDNLADALGAAGGAASKVDRQGVVDNYQRALAINAKAQAFEQGLGFHVCGRPG